MNQFLSNKIIAGLVAVALLVGVGVLISPGDTSSTTRNAALVVATPCTKPGQVTKVSKQSVVCATTNTGSLWYATMKAKGKAQACTTPGAIRKKSNIVWVCGVVKKKKLWQATQPLPPAVVASITVIEPGATQPTPALDSTQVATPDVPVVADNTVLADPKIPDDKIVTQVIEDVTTPTVAPTTPTVAPTTPTVAPTAPTVAPTTPTVAPTTPTVFPTCATGGRLCSVGETGPGGGIVFYVATTPFKCGKDLTATCARLEAAPSDFSTGLAPDDMNSEYSGLMWGGGGYASESCGMKKISGAQGTSIGSGFANTAAIVKACPDESGNNSAPAAREASNYSLSGKAGGWFLPSKDELNELCKYAHQTGQAVGGETVCSGGTLRSGFAYDGYWSSTEYKATSTMYAWVQYFTSDNNQAIDIRRQHINQKSYPYYVRPVRAF